MFFWLIGFFERRGEKREKEKVEVGRSSAKKTEKKSSSASRFLSLVLFLFLLLFPSLSYSPAPGTSSAGRACLPCPWPSRRRRGEPGRRGRTGGATGRRRAALLRRSRCGARSGCMIEWGFGGFEKVHFVSALRVEVGKQCVLAPTSAKSAKGGAFTRGRGR